MCCAVHKSVSDNHRTESSAVNNRAPPLFVSFVLSMIQLFLSVMAHFSAQ